MNKSEYKEKRDKVNKYRIEYEKYGTAEQYIEYLASKLVPPLKNMQDMEGKEDENNENDDNKEKEEIDLGDRELNDENLLQDQEKEMVAGDEEKQDEEKKEKEEMEREGSGKECCNRPREGTRGHDVGREPDAVHNSGE